MHKSLVSFLRIAGALVGAILFAQLFDGSLGNWLSGLTNIAQSILTIIGAVIGFLLGWLITPAITISPLNSIESSLRSADSGRLIGGVAGLILGLLAGALISNPLGKLPTPLGNILPFIATIGLAYLGSTIFSQRTNDLQNLLGNIPRPASQSNNGPMSDEEAIAAGSQQIILDTSVIIDGRITDISKTGFLRATLLVPNFILDELQHIADSPDNVRRNRGRRGLEVLNILRNESPIPVEITDMDVSETRAADSKLVALARHLHCPIMTNDYNLNRVAEVQGVTVLNINDLANAVKSAFLPGEELTVKIMQAGKENGQGVGYLEDGTMVVVEDGSGHINQTQRTTVTKVLQTTAGRMVFARISTNGNSAY